MDKQHKQVVTTYPVAIKSGQTRVHVQNEYPWHEKSEAVPCPECETVFIVTVGFEQDKLLDVLKKQHAAKQPHPDVIPSEPTWTRITECTCGLEVPKMGDEIILSDRNRVKINSDVMPGGLAFFVGTGSPVPIKNLVRVGPGLWKIDGSL